MRLWHQDLLSKLPRQQLLWQHREVAALRGKGWGKPHSTVNYVFKHDMSKLYDYHIKVMEEMLDRGYNVSEELLDFNYRGKILGYDNSISYTKTKSDKIYSEHDSKYLDDCLDNLMLKGIII